MKQKYNFDKIKLEYFSSPIMEVKKFFQYTYNTYTSHIKLKTKGWTIEKKEMINRIKKEAQIELEKDLKELYKPSFKQLSKIHEANIGIIQAKSFEIIKNIKKDNFGNIILPDNFNIREVKILWEIIKEEINDYKDGIAYENKKNIIEKIIVI